MVKKLTIFIFICFFLFPNVSNANEKNPILNEINKDILRKYFDEIHLIGEANYSFLLWNIYDAQLYSPAKNFNKDRFALLLRYNKKISKERLVNETIDDMKEQKTLSKNQIDALKYLILKQYIFEEILNCKENDILIYANKNPTYKTKLTNMLKQMRLNNFSNRYCQVYGI